VRIASLFTLLDSLRSRGDVIVMDYRGSGMSEPRLDCPAVPLGGDVFATRANGLAWMQAQAHACADSLAARGIDPKAYSWAAVAADIDAVRLALAVPRLRILGFSSGTHAALAAVRRGVPIERLVLIGTEGPDQTRKLPAQMDRQLALLDSLAAGAPGMATRLRVMVDSVLARAEREPIAVTVALPDGGALRGSVGRFGLEYITVRSLSGPAEFPAVVQLYSSLYRGDSTVLARVLQRFARRPPPNALTWLLDGPSGVSAARATQIAAEASHSRFGNTVNFPFPDIQIAWGYADLGDGFRKPVRSRIPTLFVTGELDGNTPADQTALTRRGFANSSHLIVANAGHADPMSSADVARVVGRFLDGADVTAERVAVPVRPVVGGTGKR
jgi:pimeloyl-ACP methyl ester carboxylesterase